MGVETKIQWANHSWSPWRGCTKIDAACENCYAAAGSKRNPNTLGIWGPNGKRVVAAESAWKQVEKWNRQAERDGVRRRVFPSLCDPFEDWEGPMHDSQGRRLGVNDEGRLQPFSEDGAPWESDALFANQQRWATMDDVRRRMFAMIDRCQWLDFLLLTKRPENIQAMWPKDGMPPRIPNLHQGGDFAAKALNHYRYNVWLLASAGTQATLDKFAPHLSSCRDLVPVIGWSNEPLLEAVDLRLSEFPVDLSIVGGESGPKSRPCNLAWIRSIRDQCAAAGVSFFLKQLGSNPLDNQVGLGVGPLRLRDSKGGDIEEFPADLRVRQMPEAVHT